MVAMSYGALQRLGSNIVQILYQHRTRGQGVEGAHIFGMISGFQNLGHAVVTVSPPGTSDPKQVQSEDSSIGKLWHHISLYVPEVFFEFLGIVYNLLSYFRMKDAFKISGVFSLEKNLKLFVRFRDLEVKIKRPAKKP